jgi:hypothetical protein
VAIRIVGGQSAAEIKRREAERRLKSALRELTANLLRIVRGSGSPDRLYNELEQCAAAFRDYPLEALPTLTEDLIRNFLDPDTALREHRPWIKHRKISEEELLREQAKRLNAMAARLNADSVRTSRGGRWTATAVKRTLERLN